MTGTAKILLVDDHPVNLIILEELLSQEYETVSVDSGEEAIRLIKDVKPALVLLDVMMPGIDGYEVCRWIRDQSELEATRVVLVSARVGTADIEQGLAAGADEYVTKPFDLQGLKATVHKFVGASAAATHPAPSQSTSDSCTVI